MEFQKSDWVSIERCISGRGSKSFQLEAIGKKDQLYVGKSGVVEYIDDIGQLHGTWGGMALLPEEDSFQIIKEEEENEKA